jgi:hypothetical protein
MSIDNATPEDWNRVVWKDNRPTTLKDYIKSKQVGGTHYKGTIEPWEAMLAWGLDPWSCNVIKYVQRHRKKNGKEAKHYLEFMIENYDAVGDKYYKD